MTKEPANSARTPLPLRVLSDAERDATRLPVVAEADPRDGLWVFAYGSLIWNPEIRHREAVPARVFGYHRAFCLRTIYSRGTPERPGLALGLDRGGSCWGLALRIAPADVVKETDVLWRREMFSGVYRPAWVRSTTPLGSRRAITFIADPGHDAYVGKLPEADVVEYLAAAHGKLGSAADYLACVMTGLEAAGIPDRHLQALHRRVEGRRSAMAASDEV